MGLCYTIVITRLCSVTLGQSTQLYEPQFSVYKLVEGRNSCLSRVDLRTLQGNVCRCLACRISVSFLFLPIKPFTHKGQGLLPRRPLKPLERAFLALWHSSPIVEHSHPVMCSPTSITVFLNTPFWLEEVEVF